MNIRTRTFALAAAFAGLATAALADPVDGMWQTEVDDGSYAIVEMGPCNGSNTCGWIRRTFNSDGEYASPNIGKPLVIDMVSNGDGTYDGNVWRPSNDKVYVGNMTLNGNSLDLAGCVLGGMICASQTWTRVQ